jgi:hypothetical protein
MAKIKGGELSFTISDDGTLKLVEQKAKKTAGAMNKVGQTAHSADRSLKGAANASSGASKNFSKLSQGITGGLVPAYATLAANLFAVDALFRFLKTSADYRVLTQGQLAFAAATGVAYKSLAHDLQAATRNMINFKDAAQAGAIGRAAGLSAGQLTELSEAAFTVSMALGRDVTDSFNRLVRGVTKAEPELLDELGIVLRLEEATTKYAASLGLNKNQLSIYQKSQAVVNEVLDQAERKFGKINAIMEPQANSIAQLGVAFEKTIDSIRPFISMLVEPVADFFTNNITAAAIAMGLFATTIISSVIPSHHDLLITQAKQTAAHDEQLERLRTKTDALQAARQKLAKTPIAQEKFMKRMGKDGLDASKLGGASGEALKTGQALTNKQIGVIKSQVTRSVGAFSGMTEQMKAKYTAMLTDMQGKTSVAQQKILLSFEGIKNGVQIKTTQMQIHWQRAMGVMAKATRTVTMALTGIMSFLSYIGIAVLLFQAGKAAYDKFFGPDQGDVDDFNKRIDESTSSLETLNKELQKMGDVVQRGLLEDALERIQHLSEAVSSASIDKVVSNFQLLENNKGLDPDKFEEMGDELLKTFDNLGRLDSRFQEFADSLRYTKTLTEGQVEELEKLTTAINTQGAAVKQLREVEGELIKEQNRLVQSLPKVPYQNLLTLLQSQAKAYKEVGEEGKAGFELASANLEYYIKIQERAIALQMLDLKMKKEAITIALGGAGSNAEQLKHAQELLKLKNQEHAIDELQLKIQSAKLDKDSVVLRGLQQQLELAKETLEVQKMQVTMAGLMADNFFSTYNKIFTDLYTDFGAGIGKAIRGEDGAFDALGKNLKNTLSDTIGDALAKQFLDDVIPDFLKPKDVAEEINKAGTYHANLVKEKIVEGGLEHSYAIARVANGMTGALEQLQIRQNNAQIGVANKEISIAQDLRGKKNAKIDILRRKDEKSKIPAFIKSNAGQKELTEYAIDNAKDKTADAIRSHLASIERVNRSTAELQARVRSGESGNTKLFSHNGLNYGGNKTINEVLTSNKTFLEGQSGYLQEKVNKFEDDFSTSLVTSVISVQKEIDNLDKEIDGLNTTIGIKGEEITQLQNVNQQRVDKIDDGSYNKLTDGDTLFDDNYGKVGNGEDGTAKEVKGLFGDEFSENLNQFGGTIGLLSAVAGKDEATAKVMTIVAKLQMANALMQRVNLMMEQKGKGIGAMFSAFIGGGGARQGGIMSKHGRSYSDGGVASGPSSGYPAVLHGREAVIPLPNGRSIPVDMGKGGGGTNNVSINVNMAEGTTETVSDREEAKALGIAINQAVYQVLEKEQRQGGLLGA